jgi:hypothetical protein
MMLCRTVRSVPLGYEHPKRDRWDFRRATYTQDFQPVFDRFYVPAVREWLAEWDAWPKGEHPDQQPSDHLPSSDISNYTFEEWSGNGPNPNYYHPGAAWPADAEMGICMYETVTEGTPISRVYPDTTEGRQAMAEEIARDDTSITSSLTVDDWLGVINGQAGAVFGTEAATGVTVRGTDAPESGL